jgi:hypothetical protein
MSLFLNKLRYFLYRIYVSKKSKWVSTTEKCSIPVHTEHRIMCIYLRQLYQRIGIISGERQEKITESPKIYLHDLSCVFTTCLPNYP